MVKNARGKGEGKWSWWRKSERCDEEEASKWEEWEIKAKLYFFSCKGEEHVIVDNCGFFHTKSHSSLPGNVMAPLWVVVVRVVSHQKWWFAGIQNCAFASILVNFSFLLWFLWFEPWLTFPSFLHDFLVKQRNWLTTHNYS